MKKAKPVKKPQEIREMIHDLLLAIGEDPTREGLRRTPHRVEQTMRWLTRGYHEDIDLVMNGAVFSSDADQMVVVRDIDVYSLCEHHMLPFFGKASIGYLPKGKIIGVSKLVRLIDVFARRLQVQEDLTMQIARTIQKKLKPAGVGVVIQAQHLCMMMRGVEKQNALFVTSAMLGRFKTDPRTRQEFLDLIKLHSRD